jgi:hypothetical protein
MPDMSGPLNLPDGSVRAILALAFTGVTIYLWGTGSIVPPELLGITGLVVGNYFGSRGSTPAAEAPEVVDAPYIPGDEGNG